MTALAPAVLLGAAVVLAAGAGFGGLGSLGQVAAGPQVPSFEQGQLPSARAKAETATPVAALASRVAAGAARPSATTGSGGGQVRSVAPVGRPRSPRATSPGTVAPTRPRSPTAPAQPQPGSTPAPSNQTAPAVPQTPSLPQTPQAPAAPAPVQPLLDLPRSLPAPVGPLTGRALDTVTGILPR